MLVAPNQLTDGEKLLLLRRRQEHTQDEAAFSHGVSLYRYRLWEKDDGVPPAVPISDVQPFELCLVMRRREGLTLADVADRLDVSVFWVSEMERNNGSCARLVEFWS